MGFRRLILENLRRSNTGVLKRVHGAIRCRAPSDASNLSPVSKLANTTRTIMGSSPLIRYGALSGFRYTTKVHNDILHIEHDLSLTDRTGSLSGVLNHFLSFSLYFRGECRLWRIVPWRRDWFLWSPEDLVRRRWFRYGCSVARRGFIVWF